MRQTNAYTFIFMTITAIIAALVLSVASQSLKKKQQFNVETDMKKNILIAVGVMKDGKCFDGSPDVISCYKKNISSFAIDNKGNIKKGDIVPERLNPVKEMDKPEDQRSYPVFARKIDNKINSYAVPVIGKGLWGTIFGYIALGEDVNVIKGITFYKHAETPGLGAEIETDWFQKSFVNKKIFNKDNKLVSVKIVKGKVDPSSPDIEHEVDGISGATLTCRGVNKLLKDSLTLYAPYFKSLKKEEKK